MDASAAPNAAPGTKALPPRRPHVSFADDFRRFFLRGLAALMPTLITLWLLVKIWQFLWETLGQHLIWAIKWVWWSMVVNGMLPHRPAGYIDRVFDVELPSWEVQLLGVGLAVVLVYIIGIFVGNLLGRTLWRLAEVGVMRIPLIRAVYPAVKQVTDFILGPKTQFESSRVVACQPHEKGIWSIGLVTGSGLKALSDASGEEMVTVFIPSSPTAFSGYVLVVPRSGIVELPLKVEEAMRLLISGGVITPLEKLLVDQTST